MYELIFYLWKEIALRVEGRGSDGKNAANVVLAWHFWACCELRRRWLMARPKQATETRKQDDWRNKPDFCYALVLTVAILIYGLAERKKGSHFWPARLEGSDILDAAAAQPEQWAPGSGWCRDNELNMEGGKRLATSRNCSLLLFSLQRFFDSECLF